MKVAGHAHVLAQTLDRPVAAGRMAGHQQQFATATSLGECREVEALAANLYFGAWTGTVTTRWASRDEQGIPEHWRAFAVRRSPLYRGHTPQKAADPINALLNYSYALAETECRTACLVLGLDPGLGVLHHDTNQRDSFALDLLETVRPSVERTVLDLLASRHLRRGDFAETRDGNCRVLPPLTHDLADRMPDWARDLAPHAETVARMLAHAADGKVAVRTPLTQANVRGAQAAVKVRQRAHRTEQPLRSGPSCRDCGAPLADTKRVLCDGCWPVRRRKLATERATRAAAQRVQLASVGADPTQTPGAKAKRTAGRAERQAAENTWTAANPQAPTDPAYYRDQVLPGLAAVPLSAIGRATGLSVAACSRIRSGGLQPHPRHWAVLRLLSTSLDCPTNPGPLRSRSGHGSLGRV